jgi:hypothetical protein
MGGSAVRLVICILPLLGTLAADQPLYCLIPEGALELQQDLGAQSVMTLATQGRITERAHRAYGERRLGGRHIGGRGRHARIGVNDPVMGLRLR